MKPRLTVKSYRLHSDWIKRFMWIVRWPDGSVESDIGYNQSETAYRDGYCVATERSTAHA